MGLPENDTLTVTDWTWRRGEHWLLTGSNESGAEKLAQRLAGRTLLGEERGMAETFVDPKSIRLVSFSESALLIEYERAHDDSDFTEGGIDPGRTAFRLISERSLLPLEDVTAHPVVEACGVAAFGHRGIKYLSTGEIRRLLLCEALVSEANLLILEDPFDGVDQAGRRVISSLLAAYMKGPGALLLVMERPAGIPDGITHALAMENHTVAFRGTLPEFLLRREKSHVTHDAAEELPVEKFPGALIPQPPATARNESGANEAEGNEPPLVEMNRVTVEWSGRKVLDSLTWKLEKGQHWLIRGPNGSGKTTFLELITGDNPQVYRNDVWLFGKKRGSGETIWEIKERMGIVSYKMHQEFRMVSDMDVESVILSGFHDSIGLYRQKGEEESLKARSWLELGGFAGREAERFSALSYGDQRAVLILRAVVKGPSILVLDEPCHGLDDKHRSRILALLEAIGNSGRTTLLHVTHDPDETLRCERNVLELRPGETPMYKAVRK